MIAAASLTVALSWMENVAQDAQRSRSFIVIDMGRAANLVSLGIDNKSCQNTSISSQSIIICAENVVRPSWEPVTRMVTQ
ncbi:hypothetical protein PA08_1976 [Cutibacterium modestum P08]|nr:hypothetical protein PA08_1976 [Cutibacterium modestum P08]